MDKVPRATTGSSDATPSSRALSVTREPSSSATERTELWPSKYTSQPSQASTSTSTAPSPLQSREGSPTRPRRSSITKPQTVKLGNRSRKNSQHDTSRPNKSQPSSASSASSSKVLSAATTPSLIPSPSESSTKSPLPQKSPVAAEHLRETPRWPVSPRLRSPPPIISRPSLPQAVKLDSDPPAINVQRSTPLPLPASQEQQSDTDNDEAHLPPGMRTPSRVSGGGNTMTLETVQEASPLASPRPSIGPALAKIDDGALLEASPPHDVAENTVSKSLKSKSLVVANESGSETGSIKAERRAGATSVPAPQLTTRQSSLTGRTGPQKSKSGDQSMTVETETVTSIPQAALAQGAGMQGSTGSIMKKPSSETIRPKKEKKKPARKQPAVAPGTASSKADIFEAKVASAVEEANSSDSEETFVYDSNPPENRDRPQRFHSRTPSATSMMSQVDRSGMRSIPGVLESAGQGVRKNMKFVNVNNTMNSTGSDNLIGDDDGKGTARSVAGSARGTARHHHHFGRWGRNGGGTSHPSLFADESPFNNNAHPHNHVHTTNHGLRSAIGVNAYRQASGPESPRVSSARAATADKRGALMHLGYDLDDTTAGADDETTPLILPGSMRSARSGRTRRPPLGMRSLEQQSYRLQPPSVLNRCASCLVLAVMLLLVISGAIGFMFATSQPLTDIELIGMKNVLASEQELMLDVTVRAKNPNIVVIAIDSADIEVFAKSPHAGTDSEWWHHPRGGLIGSFSARRKRDPPPDETAPNMRLGTIREFDSPLSFEGTFFHQGVSASTGEVRLHHPGNGTDGGSERWERIIEDEFDLILKGVLKYTLPLSGRIRSVQISGRTRVKRNSANDPTLRPNSTDFGANF